MTRPEPDSLPADPAAFYRAGTDLDALSVPDLSRYPSALERLGPSPFPKTGFKLIGFLATLYEQIATTSREVPGPQRPG